MITSRSAWHLGSGPAAGAAWNSKDLAPDGEYSTVACPLSLPLGAQPAALTPCSLGKERLGTGQPAFFTFLSG